MDYSPQGLKESDVTEAMAHEHKQGTRSRMLQLRRCSQINQSGEKKKKVTPLASRNWRKQGKALS